MFVYEWLTAARRWQMYALRALFVGVLFLAVVIVWFKHAEPLVNGAARLDRKAHAEAGEALFYAFFGTLLSVVLLLAPGATAGAVCLDKARGALVHLLVTDLSSREIVFGKLAVLSPSVWWDDRSILRLVRSCPVTVRPRVWLDAGTQEGDGSVIADLRLLRDALVEKGWREGADLCYRELECAGHNEYAWGARFGEILQYLFPRAGS